MVKFDICIDYNAPRGFTDVFPWNINGVLKLFENILFLFCFVCVLTVALWKTKVNNPRKMGEIIVDWCCMHLVENSWTIY
jgi:hypothetical protein